MSFKVMGAAVFSAAVFLSVPAVASVIDFETIPGTTPSEGLAISNQFLASEGVTFSLAGGGSPVLAKVGAPTTAFVGPPGNTGPDTPAPGQGIGSYFLTDNGTLSGLISPALIVSYAAATRAASGVILDIDFDESFTISLFDAITGGTLLDTMTINAGDPGTGDGIATAWSFDRAAADVFRIEFQGTRKTGGAFGLGFDNFDATHAIGTVPVPAGFPLLLSGLFGLVCVTRRRSAG